MTVQKLLVIGAGQMGSGIAQVAAISGLNVVIQDIKQEFIERGIIGIKNNLVKLVEKNKLTNEAAGEILGRITGTLNISSAAKDVDYVIEAVTENFNIKKEIYIALDAACPGHTVLASNTSSLPITKIAAVTKRPERVIGMHFFNPVSVMQLVELIMGLGTAEETYVIAKNLADRMKKTTVKVADFPGFCGNRIMVPMLNEAVYALMEGVSSPEDIDNVAKLGFGHPMGPLALCDLIGLDTVLYVMEVLHDGYGDDKYRPCPLLRKYVDAGWLGRKTGHGFYNY